MPTATVRANARTLPEATERPDRSSSHLPNGATKPGADRPQDIRKRIGQHGAVSQTVMELSLAADLVSLAGETA